MLETTAQIAGVDEGGFHLIARFDNKDPEQVRRTLWEGKITPPKTAKANRSIRLTGMAKEALQTHLKRGNGSEWVFSTISGTPANCHNLTNRSWWPLLKKTGLPKM